MRKLFTIFGSGVLILLLWVSVEAMHLREIRAIPLENDSEVYGISTNNIVLKNNNKLTFLNRNWEVFNEMECEDNSEWVVSENGLYYGILEEIGSDTLPEAISSTITIYTNRQSAVWSAFDIKQGDYYLSPNGDYLISVFGLDDYFATKVYFYHKDYPVREIEAVGFEKILISADGRHFMLHCGPKGDKLYNSLGQTIIESTYHSFSVFGRDSDYLAHYFDGKLEILKDGEIIQNASVRGRLIQGLRLMEDIDRSIVFHSNNLILVDFKKDSIVWDYGPSHRSAKFVSTDVSLDNKYIACGIEIMKGDGQGDDHTGYLYLYGTQGNAMQDYKITYQESVAGLPRVQFLAGQGGIITILTKNDLKLIEMY